MYVNGGEGRFLVPFILYCRHLHTSSLSLPHLFSSHILQSFLQSFSFTLFHQLSEISHNSSVVLYFQLFPSSFFFILFLFVFFLFLFLSSSTPHIHPHHHQYALTSQTFAQSISPSKLSLSIYYSSSSSSTGTSAATQSPSESLSASL